MTLRKYNKKDQLWLWMEKLYPKTNKMCKKTIYKVTEAL
jgi:hypothetical protein